jgi:phage shock protein A
MQARAGAIDELLASGALDDPTGTAKDDITRELEQLASTSEVEDELSRMKAQLGAGPSSAPQAIEGAGQPPVAQPVPNQTYAPPPQSAPQQPNQGDLR